MGFPNYAGQSDIDNKIANELTQAGIKVERLPEYFRENSGEVKTIVIGTFHGWLFKRAWRYWVATGPGIELVAAEKLHEKWGNQVRVDGHCMCPSPLECFKGLAVGHYHVDSQEGLNALADTIKGLIK